VYGDNDILSLRDIGEGRRALLCITSETGCCRDTDNTNIIIPRFMREWYFPNGSFISRMDAGHSFYRDRGPSIVRLNWRNNANSPIGIFSCIIPITQPNQIMTSTIHIGIYDIGQGNMLVCCLIFN
jgi:hypothetical protein